MLCKADDRPDWIGLNRDWGLTALLHLDVDMVTLALRAAGRVAYLATPTTEAGRGSILAADMADEWRRSVIGLAKVRCYAPAVNAQIIADFGGVGASTCKPQLPLELRLVELVVVPPMQGWSRSIDVWRVACAALAANLPVYVLAEQAGPV